MIDPLYGRSYNVINVYISLYILHFDHLFILILKVLNVFVVYAIVHYFDVLSFRLIFST